MRFKSLGSGSTGNALVIESASVQGAVTRILVDCGFTQKELVMRLAAAGLQPADLSAVFITHEHSDHLGCAFKFTQRWGIPLWMSEGTAMSLESAASGIQFAHDGRSFEIGHLRLTPFTVPHDAREPLQLRVEDSRSRLGVLTDLGQPTDYVIRNIYNCHALFLESNHEPELLARSSYPVWLKRRVSGALGHLSNQVAADILKEIRHSALQQVVAAHLSQQNNQPEYVTQLFAPLLGCAPEQVRIADADSGTPWIDIH